MALARLDAPFDHPDWLFELKYDGFRALAYVEAGNVRKVSRRGNTYKLFGKLCTALSSALPVTDAVLDGEIVYLDSDGRPQFYHLLQRRQPQQVRRLRPAPAEWRASCWRFWVCIAMLLMKKVGRPSASAA